MRLWSPLLWNLPRICRFHWEPFLILHLNFPPLDFIPLHPPLVPPPFYSLASCLIRSKAKIDSSLFIDFSRLFIKSYFHSSSGSYIVKDRLTQTTTNMLPGKYQNFIVRNTLLGQGFALKHRSGWGGISLIFPMAEFIISLNVVLNWRLKRKEEKQHFLPWSTSHQLLCQSKHSKVMNQMPQKSD